MYPSNPTNQSFLPQDVTQVCVNAAESEQGNIYEKLLISIY